MTTQSFSPADQAAASTFNQALSFIAGDTISDSITPEMKQMARAMHNLGCKSGTEILESLAKAAAAADSEDAWKIFRSFLGKFKQQMTKDLHFRVRVVEEAQAAARLKDVDLSVGDYLTYSVPAWESDPLTVADYYASTEEIGSLIDDFNEVAVRLSGYLQDAKEVAGFKSDYQLPWLWMNTAENENDKPVFEPVFDLSTAFGELDAKKEARAKAVKQAGNDMLNALLGKAA